MRDCSTNRAGFDRVLMAVAATFLAVSATSALAAQSTAPRASAAELAIDAAIPRPEPANVPPPGIGDFKIDSTASVPDATKATEPKAAKPQTAEPKTTEPKAAAGKGAETDELIKTMQAWASAWSRQDVPGYLAHYAKDFKTPGGEPRANWEKSRRQRINAPKSIVVTVDAPKVSIPAEGQASVTFRQGYRSDVLKSTNTTKTLLLARSEGRWRIQQERVGN